MTIRNFFKAKNNICKYYRAGEIVVKVGESWNTERYFQSLWLADKKNFRILDALEWLKQ